MTTDADDIDLMMVDLSQGRKRLQRWDGDLVPWGWTGVKQNVYKCANFGHFWQKHFQVIEQKISELEKKRMELESNLVNMLREKLEKNERWDEDDNDDKGNYYFNYFSEFTVTF